MTPADKLLTQIKEDREIRAKATSGMWSQLDEPCEVHAVEWTDGAGDPLHICDRVNTQENADFIITAANNWERKNRQLEIAVDAAKRILRKVPDKVSREEAADMAIEFQHELRKALEEMEAVK